MIFRRINDGERLPSIWWGFYRYDYDRRQVVIAPIGLNVILAGLSWAYRWVAHAPIGWWPRER